MLPSGLFQIVFVMTIVNTHLTVINFKDAVDETAQEVAVMADEHHRAEMCLRHGILHIFEYGLLRLANVHGMLTEIVWIEISHQVQASGRRLGLTLHQPDAFGCCAKPSRFITPQARFMRSRTL
jgi:hypothetical protein